MLDLLRQQPPLPIQVLSQPSEARMLGQWEGFSAAIDAIESLSTEKSWRKQDAPETKQIKGSPDLDID